VLLTSLQLLLESPWLHLTCLVTELRVDGACMSLPKTAE
jgi:hypothetical protein